MGKPRRVAPGMTRKPAKKVQAKRATPASKARVAKQVAYKAATRNTVARPKPAAAKGPVLPPKRPNMGPGGQIGNAHQSFFDIGKFLKSLGGG